MFQMNELKLLDNIVVGDPLQWKDWTYKMLRA
jgi:hypothetical protein